MTTAKTNSIETPEQRDASRPKRADAAVTAQSGVVRVAERLVPADLDVEDPYYDLACTD
jgi:hypothetical protein